MRALLFCFLSLLCSVRANPAPAPVYATPEDIAETAKWFDQLSWPKLEGKPYVEITRTHRSKPDEPAVITEVIRGFILAEDEQALTFIADGILNGDLHFARHTAYMVTRWEKSPNAKTGGVQVSYRALDLAKAVDEVIASRRPKNPPRPPGVVALEQPIPPMFALARFCAWQGRKDLAGRLEAEIQKRQLVVPFDWRDHRGEDAKQPPLTLRTVMERTLARAAMDRAMDGMLDTSVSRPELLARLARVAKDFPGHEDTGSAPEYVKILKQMLAEDEAHAKAPKKIADMSPQEQVEEWIYQLREQTGYQPFNKGNPFILRIWEDGGRTPADQLVRLDAYAVPALIELLGDERLTRVGGSSWSSSLERSGINYGDCAETILAKISGIEFSNDARVRDFHNPLQRVKALRIAVATWWKSVGDRGLRKVMLEGIRKGNADSVQQARRLAVTDNLERVAALSAGIAAATTNNVRAALVQELTRIDNEAAKVALKREMTQCASLVGRATAATALFRGGDEAAVPAMIAEWKKWRPAPHSFFDEDSEDPEPFIIFITTCGHLDAMRAVIERYPSLPRDVRQKVLEFATGTDFFHQTVRPREEALSPEVQALVEELVGSGLNDRSVQDGAMGMGQGGSYYAPRVCDFAARALAQRWPERYSFKWDATRVERDRYVEAARKTLHTAKGLPAPPPLVTRPEIDTTGKSPNLIAGIRWVGGEPHPKITLTQGEPLTAQATLETIVALHAGVPADCHGFRFSAERPGDGKGFVIEIEWLRGARPEGGGEHWSFTCYIGQGDAHPFSSAGGSSYDLPATHEHYNDQRAKLESALGLDASRPSVIYFSDRMSK